MDNYMTYYKSKAQHRGVNQRERNLRQMQRTFDLYFRNTLNRHTCLLNGEEVDLVFQDHSQSNNKDLSDDKYVIAPNSIPLKTGDYIIWQQSHWMIFTKEFKTILTHQQAKIKEVNEMIKWVKDDGEISNNGMGWPAYAISQTLYTMGVSENTYIPVVDSKVMLHMQYNDETVSLGMNKRLFVGGRVYLTKYINTVSRPGIVSLLLDETTIGPNDNVELGIADYYGKTNEPEPETPVETSAEIVGETDPKFGNIYHYEARGFKAVEWTLDHFTNDTPAYLDSANENGVNLKFKNDARYIGETINLIAKTEQGNYITITLYISKKF